LVVFNFVARLMVRFGHRRFSRDAEREIDKLQAIIEVLKEKEAADD
jgi:hypothetical protein